MIKTLAAANKSEREPFKIPRSVQQSIPIQRVFRDGIWQTGRNRYKKMIIAQFVKAVRVKRDYEIEVEFNVAFDEFQQIYLEPEKRRTRRGARQRSLPL